MVQIPLILSTALTFLRFSNAQETVLTSLNSETSFNARTPRDLKLVPVIKGTNGNPLQALKVVSTRTPCIDTSGVSGVCTPLGSCPVLLAIAQSFPSGSPEYQLLRKSYCGNINSLQLFCCRATSTQTTTTTKRTTTPKSVTAKSAVTTKSTKMTTTPSNKNKCETANELNSRFCGTPSTIAERIVGGKGASKGAWPWAALLFDRSSPEVPFCGGSLITNRHVLTAAHCLVSYETAANLVVRLAEHDYSTRNDGKHANFNVSKISKHPQYTRKNHNNDIAILHLDRGVCFSDKVTPVCVPDSSWSRKISPGLRGIAVGWGINDPADRGATKRSPVLHEVTLEIFSPDTCKNAYRRVVNAPTLHDKVICSGDRRGGKDACKGDSGGPLMLFDDQGRFVVAGIVSAGVSCGRKDFPGIFTKVSEYYPWILQVTSS